MSEQSFIKRDEVLFGRICRVLARSSGRLTPSSIFKRLNEQPGQPRAEPWVLAVALSDDRLEQFVTYRKGDPTSFIRIAPKLSVRLAYEHLMHRRAPGPWGHEAWDFARTWTSGQPMRLSELERNTIEGVVFLRAKPDAGKSQACWTVEFPDA